MLDLTTARRKPLLNLMRVVGLSGGVVSRRTLRVLMAIAEVEPVDRKVERWVQLMLAIDNAEQVVETPPELGYRRRFDPDGVGVPSSKSRPRKPRKTSGVRPRLVNERELEAIDDKSAKSG